MFCIVLFLFSVFFCVFLDVHHQGHGSHYSVQHAAGHYCRDSTISTGQLRVSQHGCVLSPTKKESYAHCWSSCNNYFNA